MKGRNPPRIGNMSRTSPASPDGAVMPKEQHARTASKEPTTALSRWFSRRWLRPGESRRTALLRICSATRLNEHTVRSALRGTPMRSRKALLLASVTEGRVSAAHLALGELHLHSTAETTNAPQP